MLKKILYNYNDEHNTFPNIKGYGGLGYHLPEYRKVIHGSGSNDIDSILKNIKNSFDTNLYYLYINNKLICKEKTIPKIKTTLKESHKNPGVNEKGFLISLSIDKNYKYPLMINCSSYTIGPKLSLLSFDDDSSNIFIAIDA